MLLLVATASALGLSWQPLHEHVSRLEKKLLPDKQPVGGDRVKQKGYRLPKPPRPKKPKPPKPPRLPKLGPENLSWKKRKAAKKAAVRAALKAEAAAVDPYAAGAAAKAAKAAGRAAPAPDPSAAGAAARAAKAAKAAAAAAADVLGLPPLTAGGLGDAAGLDEEATQQPAPAPAPAPARAPRAPRGQPGKIHYPPEADAAIRRGVATLGRQFLEIVRRMPEATAFMGEGRTEAHRAMPHTLTLPHPYPHHPAPGLRLERRGQRDAHDRLRYA